MGHVEGMDIVMCELRIEQTQINYSVEMAMNLSL